MENNDLEDKIRKMVKEKIAVSNIKEEFKMKENKNRKTIYFVTSVCAVFVLGIGILGGMAKNSPQKNYQLGEANNQKLVLKINHVNGIGAATLDAQQEIIDTELPSKFDFIKNIKVPAEYKETTKYTLSTRSDMDSTEYDILHDYVFTYTKNVTDSIRIAVSEIETPLRDYFMEEKDQVSKIGDTKIIIGQYNNMYMATFKYNNMYFDIETEGLTESELISLLSSIIK